MKKFKDFLKRLVFSLQDMPRAAVLLFFTLIVFTFLFITASEIQDFIKGGHSVAPSVVEATPVYTACHPWLSELEGLGVQVPRDRINLSQTTLTNTRFELRANSLSYAEYEATGSMRPLLDKGSLGIYIDLEEAGDLSIGDIISFKLPTRYIGFDRPVVHRIIGIGEDEEGVYYTTKGDNLLFADPFKVREEHIQGVLIGVIW